MVEIHLRVYPPPLSEKHLAPSGLTSGQSALLGGGVVEGSRGSGSGSWSRGQQNSELARQHSSTTYSKRSKVASPDCPILKQHSYPAGLGKQDSHSIVQHGSRSGSHPQHATGELGGGLPKSTCFAAKSTDAWNVISGSFFAPRSRHPSARRCFRGRHRQGQTLIPLCLGTVSS